MSRFAQEKDPEILHKAIDLLQNHNRALATKISELLKELAEAKGDSGFQQLVSLRWRSPREADEGDSAETEQPPAQPPTATTRTTRARTRRRRSGPGMASRSSRSFHRRCRAKLDEADKTCPACGAFTR
jgi:hypothetical protein